MARRQQQCTQHQSQEETVPCGGLHIQKWPGGRSAAARVRPARSEGVSSVMFPLYNTILILISPRTRDRRHEELETIERITADFASATAGKPNYVTGVYLAQRQVPINCTDECRFELERKAYWRLNQTYRANLNFRRQYVEAVRYEWDPEVGGSYSYKTTASWNVSGN